MARALLVVSAVAILAWSVLAALGAFALFVAFGLPSTAAFGLYVVGLVACIWLGFRSAGRMSIKAALIAQAVLLLIALFIVSGGLVSVQLSRLALVSAFPPSADIR